MDIERQLAALVMDIIEAERHEAYQNGRVGKTCIYPRQFPHKRTKESRDGGTFMNEVFLAGLKASFLQFEADLRRIPCAETEGEKGRFIKDALASAGMMQDVLAHHVSFLRSL